MKQVSYTNETQNFQHVGGVTVPPGETRDVDASLLPGYKPDGAPEPEVPIDLIAELLKGNVKNISLELPGMSEEDLSHAAALEQDGLSRKSLLAAITEETLRRATAKAAAAEEQPADPEKVDADTGAAAGADKADAAATGADQGGA